MCVCSLEFISWLFVITGNNSAVAWQWPVLTPMIANILLLLPSLWIVNARFLSTKNVLFSKHLILFLFLGEYQEILLLHYLMISKSYSPSASIAAALFVYPKILVITQILLVLSKGIFLKKGTKSALLSSSEIFKWQTSELIS